MKSLCCALAVAAIGFAGCNSDYSRAGQNGAEEVILRAHFAGGQRLASDKNAPQLSEVWNLPSTVQLRDKAVSQFSRLPYLWLSNALPKGVSDESGAFKSLLEDALAHESALDWRNGSVALAAKLSAAQSGAWDKNLRRVLTNWKLGSPANFEAGGRFGWELGKVGLGSLRFARAGDWTVVTLSAKAATAEQRLLDSVNRGADGAWLKGEANLAQFKGRIPLLEYYQNLPTARFSLSNRADFVRTMVQMDFPKAHGWKAEAWQIPTNVLCDPLMDFTALRGAAGLLEPLPFVRNVGFKPTPSQIFGWGNRGVPFQLCYAAPSKGVTAQLKGMLPKVRDEVFNRGTKLNGAINFSTNRQQLAWQGLPVSVPALGSLRDGKTEYLELEFFPLTRTRHPAPKEIFEQFAGRNDLVMYDWETTQYRIPTWLQAYQLAEIATFRPLTQTNMPSYRWQVDMGTRLGDAITELKATGPNQMTLVRKSSIGLTAFELVTLSRWIDSSSFPAFGIFPPHAPHVRPVVKPKGR